MLSKTEDCCIALFCFNPQAGFSHGWRMAAGAIRLHASLAYDRKQERERQRERHLNFFLRLDEKLSQKHLENLFSCLIG